MTVNCVIPKAVDDPGSGPEITVDEGGSVIIDVLANDYDPDGDPLSVTEVSDPANFNGTAAINPDGTITYTPNVGFCGTDSFTYTISDDDDGESTATVTVLVCPAKAIDDSVTMNEGGFVTIDVLANDKPDPDILDITHVSDPFHGTANINDGCSITYTPEPDFCGTDNFIYTISDGDGGTDTVVVSIEVNCYPVAVNDAASVDEGGSVIIDVLANDYDPDGDPLSVTAVSDPVKAAINPDGTVTYTPDTGFCGTTDSFTYTISDGKDGSTDEATVTVTVNCLLEAVDDTASVDEGGSVIIDVLANDKPDPASLTVIHVSDPNNGTAVINTDGTITYTPDDDFGGINSFTYTISDGDSGTDEATVTVTVNSGPITFADANLEAAVREALGIGPEETITKEMALTLTWLPAGWKGIEKLGGLEYFINLVSLHLFYNSISDISALSGLTNLYTLYLTNNSISDISALSGLTNLLNLWLGDNSISDISALSGLTNLQNLDFKDNSISNISALSGLTNLQWLDLYNNNISDISALSGMTNLQNLCLHRNNISDISALSDLTNLQKLSLEFNNISDISILSSLTNLPKLFLDYNNISDISALSGLTNLQELWLWGNNISDISALVANSGLGTGDKIELGDNPLIQYVNCYQSHLSEEECQAAKEVNGAVCSDVQTLRSRGATVKISWEFSCP